MIRYSDTKSPKIGTKVKVMQSRGFPDIIFTVVENHGNESTITAVGYGKTRIYNAHLYSDRECTKS